MRIATVHRIDHQIDGVVGSGGRRRGFDPGVEAPEGRQPFRRPTDGDDAVRAHGKGDENGADPEQTRRAENGCALTRLELRLFEGRMGRADPSQAALGFGGCPRQRQFDRR
jgi:hypothetical protein